MPLEIYVGSFSRYHSVDGSFEPADSLAPEVDPTAATSDDEIIGDVEAVETIVADWINQVADQLRDHMDTPLQWEDRAATESFTATPDWDGWRALLMLAAYSEHADIPPPAALPETFEGDPAYQASTAADFDTQYSQIFFPEVWLPGDFQFVFSADDVTERSVVFGSLHEFLRQLRELDTATFKLWDRLILESLPDSAPPNPAPAAALTQLPWADSARTTLATALHMAQRAVEFRLPMRLDY